MTGFEFIKAELARISWNDGNEEAVAGCLGVAFTIRNRVRAGWYNGDWIQVLSHHKEWSYRLESPELPLPDPRHPVFRVLLQEVDGIFSGQREDNVTISQDPISNSFRIGVISEASRPALYYGRLNAITSPWFLESISRNTANHRLIAQVGGLAFFN